MSEPNYDLYDVLTKEQRKQLEAKAKKAGMTPAEFVIDFFVKQKLIPDSDPEKDFTLN